MNTYRLHLTGNDGYYTPSERHEDQSTPSSADYLIGCNGDWSWHPERKTNNRPFPGALLQLTALDTAHESARLAQVALEAAQEPSKLAHQQAARAMNAVQGSAILAQQQVERMAVRS